jgi:hypothetical protein
MTRSTRVQYARVETADTPPVAPRRVRVLCALGLVGLAAYFGVLGARSIGAQTADFEYFYTAGAYLLTHGELDRGLDRLPSGRIERRGTIEWYLPFVSRLVTLIAWLPFGTAGAVWLALNLLAFFAILVLLGRHVMGLPPQDWPVTLLVPVLLLALFWHWEFRLNQVDNFTLLLVVASFVHWQQRRPKAAGFWLGLAVLLKVTPALLVLWFALKRQFKTVGVAVVTMALAGPVADVIVFRPAYAADAYREWFDTAVRAGSHRGLVIHQKEMDWRNQGLGAVLSRWLHPTNYALHFDNDPRIKINRAPATLNVAKLSRTTVATLVTALTVLCVVSLCWLARRPARRLTLWQLRAEWALFVLAMLGLMPVLRRYHLILMLPALAVLASAIHYAGARHRWSKLALVCIGGVLAGQLAVLTRVLPEAGVLRWFDGLLGRGRVEALSNVLDAGIVEAAGVLLLTVVLLAIPLVVLLLRLARQPDALPEQAYAPAHPSLAESSTPPSSPVANQPAAARA